METVNFCVVEPPGTWQEHIPAGRLTCVRSSDQLQEEVSHENW